MNDGRQVPRGVDPNRPSPARMYDYMLSGKHNFQSDRDAVERFRAQLPDLGDAAWANRAFHQRAARWLAAERGIRQFIDLGCGMPTAPDTLESARGVIADARVAYVDNDPVVLSHLNARVAKGTPGVTVVGGDVREVPVILDLIHALKARRDKTILLVEHKMDVVRELADRIIVLHNGALVADGEPAAVIASPIVQEAYLGIEVAA